MTHRAIRTLLASLAVGIATTLAATPAVAAASAHHFRNCTDLHRVYPHGVGTARAHDHVTSGRPVTTFKRSDALYTANRGSDRDHDHVACEKH